MTENFVSLWFCRVESVPSSREIVIYYKVIFYPDISKSNAVYYHMETIGSRLKLYAKARCGSVRRLAEELGMRPDNLQKYASDRHEPGAKLLQQLAAHGCNVHWLIAGVGQMLVEDMTPNETSGEKREMLNELSVAGVSDVGKLRMILIGLKQTLEAHESLTGGLGLRGAKAE